ncbi:hypothetical protein HY414_01145 [Candidatus Kaiserbacteria bacterium]|nr:hypothetical protein [Candidatus Kaiserbacteria bacterium]
MGTTPLCPWEAPTYLIFSPNAYTLFYYAHFVPILIGGCLVGILLWQNPRSLAIRLLTVLFGISTVWILIDMMSTATNRPDTVVFLWSVIVLIEPLLYVAALFLFYAFAFNKLPSFAEQLGITALLTPLIVLAPTTYNIPGIYIEDCNADEGFIASHYSYGVEIALTFWILFIAILAIVRTRNAPDRRKLTFFLVGLIAFLVSFASGNLIGTFTGDWVTAQYGLFGLPIFIAFLGYIVVRFRAFNVKILEAQALVIAVSILVFSLLFIRSIENIRLITVITFILIGIMGYILVRNVRKEIEQRELIEKQEKELKVANKQQESLLHFISHEVKGYLTESQAGFASIVEGDFGTVPDKLKTMAGGALASVRRGVSTIMDLLDASNFKKGTMTFAKNAFDLRKAVRDVVDELKPSADEKSLTIDLAIGEGAYMFTGDEDKIRRHVIRNLIDNAIKYTPRGSVKVELTDGEKLRFAVKDSGVGITPEDMRNLFTEGGHGKNAIKVNVHSTGYGLFIAKEVVEAQGGKIWAESEGEGKGSTFIVEFPIA